METQQYRKASHPHTGTVLAQVESNRLRNEHETFARHHYEYQSTKELHRKSVFYAFGMLLLAGILYLLGPLLVR